MTGRFDVNIIRKANRCLQCDKAVYIEYGNHSEDFMDYKVWVAVHVDKNGRVVECNKPIDISMMKRVR
jgi:hypothetical protein